MATDNISAALSKASGQLKVNLQTAKSVEKDVFVTKPGFYLGGKKSMTQVIRPPMHNMI